MGSTNKTSNIELSQFLGTDKPSWLNDYNADMERIDSAIGENVTDISTAQSRADSAYNLADNASSGVSALATQVSANTTDIATAQGNINSINSLIGNGTPTTTDQTIIGAINELNAGKVGFIDTTNLLYSDVSSVSGSHSYSWTATENGYVYVTARRDTGQPFCTITLDGVEVAQQAAYVAVSGAGTAFISISAFVKKGQVVAGQYTSNGTDSSGAKIYALM